MGFGILFSGYIFLMSVSLHAFGICAELLGYLLMLRALFLLKAYKQDFGRARYFCAALVPMGVYSLFMQCLKWLGMEDFYTRLDGMLSLGYSILLALLLLFFHHYLLSAVRSLAEDVALPDIVRQTVRNRIFTYFYFVLTITVSFLDIPAVTEKVSYASLVSIVTLVGVVWMLLNAKMIFNCYMWICLPGDEDMPAFDRKLPRIFSKPDSVQELTEEEKAAKAAEQKRLAEQKWADEVRARQEARTKKNKRGKNKK